MRRLTSEEKHQLEKMAAGCDDANVVYLAGISGPVRITERVAQRSRAMNAFTALDPAVDAILSDWIVHRLPERLRQLEELRKPYNPDDAPKPCFKFVARPHDDHDDHDEYDEYDANPFKDPGL